MVKGGDKNVQFFHACATQRCRNNKIQMVNVSTQGGGEEVFRNHFQHVYLSSNPLALDIEKGIKWVVSKVNPAMDKSLMDPFIKGVWS